MKTPEGEVKLAIKRRLNDIGAYQYWPVPFGFGKRGVDCYGCWRGFFFAVEAKAPGAKPTDNQTLTLASIEKAGGFTCVEDDKESLHALNCMIKAMEERALLSGDMRV